MNELLTNDALVGAIVINGIIKLASPLIIGGGEEENDVDIAVLKKKSGEPFIPGTSLAGVLREKIRNISPMDENVIFGDDSTAQSMIQIEDILLKNYHYIIRDGVKIEDYTGVAFKGAKFDFEAVEKNASGEFKLIFLIRKFHLKDCDFSHIKEKASLIIGLLSDGLLLGAMTTKGFGKIYAEKIEGGLYDFSNKTDVSNWILNDNPLAEKASVKLLPTENIPHNNFNIEADFAIENSLIIREYIAGLEENGVKISAKTLTDSEGNFVIPGSSLKGAFRHHSLSILNKLEFKNPEKFLNNLMGIANENIKIKSRFYISEVYFKNGVKEAEQTRVRIDRFTGGALKGALFTTKPLWQTDKKICSVKISFFIENATEAEKGLALLLLRDLSIGRLALGGEKSIGRGTLLGLSAKICDGDNIYKINEKGKVTEGNFKDLETMPIALKEIKDRE